MLNDIYVLAPERAAGLVELFLERFIPERDQSRAEYGIPEFCDKPLITLATSEELIAYCCKHTDVEQRAYWLNRAGGEPQSAHVFFLPEGGLVLGISVFDPEQLEGDRWLTDLRSFSGAEYGYCILECPPEDTVAKFIARARRIVQQDGKLACSDSTIAGG